MSGERADEGGQRVTWMRGAETRLRGSSFTSALLRKRYLVQLTGDATTWAIAITFAAWIRYDLHFRAVDVGGLAKVIPIAMLAQVVLGLGFGLYLGRWRFGSFEEVAALGRVAGSASIVVFSVNLLLGSPRPVPMSSTIAGGAFAFLMQGSARYAWRLVLESRRRPQGESLTRLVVVGAGEAGQQVIHAMLRDPSSPYLPVALLDDDPTKRHLRLSGVPVRGTTSDLEDVAAATGATAVLVAVPSANQGLIGDVTARGDRSGLDVKVLPPMREVFGDAVDVSDIRDVTEADLLGRHVISTDLASIAGNLTGRRVLVTGAGGSIGSELCRQIWRYAPSELVMLDRDESALHAVQLSIEGRALLDTDRMVLADIRERDRVFEVFERYQPQVVFHAAALKHLPLLEQNPHEAAKSNIWGTLHVLEAAAKSGVERFVNISTDKAADPTSVLGYSKRIAERRTASVAASTPGTFLSVRFGNVLGSRGSALTAFYAQLAQGGPLTVTHPEVTRYFMTVQEAVELVIQAAAIGRDGEALVLDMGTPVKIADIASRLASRADRPIKIVYTGLRPGEKLHEVLLGRDEPDVRPVHPLISHVTVPPLEPNAIEAIDLHAPPAAVTAALRVLSAPSIVR